MADIANNQKNTTGIESVTTGYDLIVNPEGSINTQEMIAYWASQDKAFTLSGSFSAATAGSDNPIFLVKNPNASGKTLRLRRLFVGCSVANVLVTFKAFYAPTITSNGTSQTPRNNLIGSSTASIATAFSIPTLSSNGTGIGAWTIGQNSTGMVIPLDLDLQANQNIVVTADPGSNNRTVEITLVWAEV